MAGLQLSTVRLEGPSHAPRKDISVNDLLHTGQGSHKVIVQLKHSCCLAGHSHTKIMASVTCLQRCWSKAAHRPASRVWTYSYVQRLILDNNNKRLRYWFLYVLYYFYCYLRVYSSCLKFAVMQPPQPSRVSCVSRLHRFVLCLL